MRTSRYKPPLPRDLRMSLKAELRKVADVHADQVGTARAACREAVLAADRRFQEERGTLLSVYEAKAAERLLAAKLEAKEEA